MKLYILDKYKIIKFDLPKTIEDSFLVPYMGYDNKEKYLTVEANNDSWYLKSNGNINAIKNDEVIDKVLIREYSSCVLKVLGQEGFITLYVMPSYIDETYLLKVKEGQTIVVGSTQDCNISYKNGSIAGIHAQIKSIDNNWYIESNKDEKFKVYLNGKRAFNDRLKCGDIIFINGLKIIWMQTFIKINNPNKQVNVQGMPHYAELDDVDNTQYVQATDEESNVEFYNENEYFYHVPRLVSTIDEFNFEIDTPPAMQNKEELPFILTIGSSLTMGASSILMCFTIYNSLSKGRSSFIEVLPQIIILVAMIFSSLILPRIADSYQKKKAKKREEERQQKYKAYLNKMDTKIQYALKQQIQILKENNLSFQECYDAILKKNRFFWSREIADDDFLTIRLGIGNIKSKGEVNAPQEHFTLDEDNLQDMAFEVDKRSKTLIDAPVTTNLTDQTSISLILNCSYKNEYINGIITQIVALHSPSELKLVIFTNKENKEKWEYSKFLPHCWADDKSFRFFATTSDEYKEISTYLEEQYKARFDKAKVIDEKDKTDDDNNPNLKQFKTNAPYYLIITDCYNSIKSLEIFDSIQKNSINVGFTIFMISDSIKFVSNKCEKFIEIGEKESCILSKNLSVKSQVIFQNERADAIDMENISQKLSNVPVLTKDANSSLPSTLSFLEMYNVGKIEQLNIMNRWKTNSPVTTLSTTVGVHPDGDTFKLDLHEKSHGPHGLIAGSTGSGKSEFIITYILSMCVNYHPYEVQFVLIDYKGGGLAGAFENKETGVKVPHLVGSITNLDSSEMNRALVSLSSELKRRQRKFNEVKEKLDESTMDIYKYQRLYRDGLINEPMSHLFIISDEFAELKSQQPEFLNELVSIARIGRSLGVHLILATQKPSGVVNDQIWSNSKFKICLKVQDKSDSMEMLKRPEAASIKDVGRFYLQVGYDDYFGIGQSGWSGAKYIPTDRIVKKIDDSVNFINNIGTVTRTVNDAVKKESNVDLGEQLNNIVKYIYNLSVKEKIHSKKLWLDKISDLIFLGNLKLKYQYKPTPYLISPVIGEYDNPKEQEQGLLNLDLFNNTLIYGPGGSGKENLISTILWSSMTEHTPEEVNFYVIDCGAEVLKMFYNYPHIGEICSVDEAEKIIETLTLVDSIIDERKEKYVEYGGSFKNYCEYSSKRDPLIVVIINNYEIFNETYSKVADAIETLYRDGEKYGVTFIISCTTTNSIRGRVAQYFKNKIALQLANNDDYRLLLDAPKNLVPFKCFGRGLVTFNDSVYEFQTANICESNKILPLVREVVEKLCKAYETRAKKIPIIPDVVSVDTFKNDISSLEKVPIGYNISNKEKYFYNFMENKFNMIISNNINNHMGFAVSLIKELSWIQNVRVKVLDFKKLLNEKISNVSIYDDHFENVVATINNEIIESQKTNAINYYVLFGLGNYRLKLSTPAKKVLDGIFSNSSNFKNTYFLLIDNYTSCRNLLVEDWYQSTVDATNGIWLGSGIGNQNLLTVNNLQLDDKKIDFEYMGFSVTQGEYTVIKYVVDKEESNEK